MITSDQQDIASDRRIYIGFAVGLAIAVTLNVASYWFFVTPNAADAAKFKLPQVHKLGVPRTFWVEDKIETSTRLRYPNLQSQSSQSQFYGGAFLFDVVAALAVGIACAQWYQESGAPVVTPPEESPSTRTPK